MSEHQRETAFLRHSIVFDDTDERRKLEERIAQVQRDERCVQRAAWLMVLFASLGAAGLAYGALLQENFPYGTSWLVIKLLCELGLASLIPLVALVGLLMVYRRKLNCLREECRRLVTKLLESRLGKSHITPLRASHLGAGDREVAEGVVEVNGSPARLDSLREGVVHGLNKTSPETNSSP
jgi:hypothetical protein